MEHEKIAEEYYDGLYRFALSLSKREEDAADLVQQTYLKWVKHRDRIRDVSKVKSWLFTTLHREFLRDRKRRNRVNYMEDNELERELPAVEEKPDRKLDGQLAMKALQDVPNPFRAALTLFYVQDFSYAEIAEVLNISTGTVMSRIYRGKHALKELIRKRETPLGPPLAILGDADGS